METLSASLAICVGNSPVPGEFPTQRPVTWSFDVFFDLHLNKRLSKQWWGWWFETLSRPLWRQCNVYRSMLMPSDGVPWEQIIPKALRTIRRRPPLPTATMYSRVCWSRPTLIQIMTCRLFDAKPLSEKCWLIIDWNLRNKLQWHSIENTFFIQEN